MWVEIKVQFFITSGKACTQVNFGESGKFWQPEGPAMQWPTQHVWVYFWVATSQVQYFFVRPVIIGVLKGLWVII